MSRYAWLWGFLVLGGCIFEASSEPACGDAVLDPGELCDDGNTANGDGCSSACTTEICGNGIVDAGERCDDGNAVNGDGCSVTCGTESCGNAVVEPGEECDDGNVDAGDGCSASCESEAEYATTVRWSIATVDAPGVPLPCPTGFDTAAIHSQRVGSDGTPVGPPLVDLFDCDDLEGTIVPVLAGRYLTHVAITDATLAATYATSTSALVDLTSSNATMTTTIFEDGGYFAVAWALVGASSNSALTCAQVADIDGVSVLSTDVAGPTSFFEDIFACEDGGGLTAVLPEATYTVAISALDGDGAAIGEGPVLTSRVIQGPNRVTDLGAVTVAIDGL